MGINTKGKRKITVNSKKYLWWVFNEMNQTEFDGNQIKIVPKFEDENGIIKPSGIERLIKWCLEKSTDKNRILVHGYNPTIGIIPDEDRAKTLETILNEFEK